MLSSGSLIDAIQGEDPYVVDGWPTYNADSLPEWFREKIQAMLATCNLEMTGVKIVRFESCTSTSADGKRHASSWHTDQPWGRAYWEKPHNGNLLAVLCAPDRGIAEGCSTELILTYPFSTSVELSHHVIIR